MDQLWKEVERQKRDGEERASDRTAIHAAREQGLPDSRSLDDTLTVIEQGITPPAPTSARNKRPRQTQRSLDASPTKTAQALSRPRRTTLVRRPSRDLAANAPFGTHGGLDSAGPARSKRQSLRNSGSLDSIVDFARARPRAEDVDAHIPIAGEEPSLDLHVQLLLPQSRNWDNPILVDVAGASDLSVEAKEHLAGWFRYLTKDDDTKFGPWWIHGGQAETACMANHVISRRASVWIQEMRACQSCQSMQRPCMRLFFERHGDLRYHRVRVLPAGSDNPFEYWQSPPPPREVQEVEDELEVDSIN